MKCKSIILGVKLAMVAFVLCAAAMPDPAYALRIDSESRNRMLVYANSSSRVSLPDLPSFAAWASYLEKALRDEAYRRDSVGLSDARIEVYAADDSTVAHLVNRLYQLLDLMNLQYRVSDESAMRHRAARGKRLHFENGLKPQAYFDLRDSLLHWRKVNLGTPIQVQVQETPYSPRTGIDSVLHFVEQLKAIPLKDKAGF